MAIGLVTFLVRDYDEAIVWFRRALDFRVVEDTQISSEKRWVVMAPSDPGGANLLLAKAVGAQADFIGRQAGGRVGLFLSVTDFDAASERLRNAGVDIEAPPRREVYGEVAVFRDLYGGAWDLIGPPK